MYIASMSGGSCIYRPDDKYHCWQLLYHCCLDSVNWELEDIRPVKSCSSNIQLEIFWDTA